MRESDLGLCTPVPHVRGKEERDVCEAQRIDPINNS